MAQIDDDAGPGTERRLGDVVSLGTAWTGPPTAVVCRRGEPARILTQVLVTLTGLDDEELARHLTSASTHTLCTAGVVEHWRAGQACPGLTTFLELVALTGYDGLAALRGFLLGFGC